VILVLFKLFRPVDRSLAFLKSGWLPRPIGKLLILGCFGYLVELFVSVVYPSYEIIIALGIAVAIAAELSFTFWLLFGKLGGGSEVFR